MGNYLQHTSAHILQKYLGFSFLTMLAVRSFAAPARRQCLQASRRAWVPTSVHACRQYATGKDPVAKFTGQKGSDGLYTVSLIEGDGIGPEIAQSVKDIFAAAKTPIKWEPVDVTPQLVDGKTSILPETIESIKRNKVALKGPLAVSYPASDSCARLMIL